LLRCWPTRPPAWPSCELIQRTPSSLAARASCGKAKRRAGGRVTKTVGGSGPLCALRTQLLARAAGPTTVSPTTERLSDWPFPFRPIAHPNCHRLSQDIGVTARVCECVSFRRLRSAEPRRSKAARSKFKWKSVSALAASNPLMRLPGRPHVHRPSPLVTYPSN
jgi:hypothetical protein